MFHHAIFFMIANAENCPSDDVDAPVFTNIAEQELLTASENVRFLPTWSEDRRQLMWQIADRKCEFH